MRPGVLREIRAWVALLVVCINYLLYRAGLRECPTLTDRFYECMLVFGRVLGWPRRLAVRGAEHVPAGPAVFCENHLYKDDPFVTGAATYLATGESWLHYMMRDDFFPDGKWLGVIEPNDLVRMMGAHLINRDKVTVAQLKVFVQLLRGGQPFLMFPGRTRSRSGLFMEYRDDVQEPGGPTFFVAQAQRAADSAPIPMVPVARTHNPVSGRITVAYGAPMHLPPAANREDQRNLDYALVEAMAGLVEVNAVHLTCGLAYLKCLHGRTAPEPVAAWSQAAARVAAALEGCLLDPAVTQQDEAEVRRTLEWLAESGMVRREGDAVTPVTEAILAQPELDRGFRDANPVRFHVNQVLHLAPLTRALETEVLRQPVNAPSA